MTDQTDRLLRDAENYLSALHGSVARHDNLAANLGCAGCDLRDRIATELRTASSAGRAPAADRDALVLQRVRKSLEARLDQVAVDPAEVYNLLAEVPLSPFYEHPECGFHWHGRDGMDIPMRDGQPVCPRCELRRLAGEAQQDGAAS